MFWCLVSYYLRVHRHSKDIVVPLFMSYDIRQHRSGLVLFWRSLTIPPMVSFLKMPKMHCPTPSQYSFLIACYSLTTTWWQNFGTKLVDTLFFDLAVINTYCLILAVLSTQSLVLLCLWQGLKNTQSVVVPFSHTSVPSEKWKWFQISFCSLLTPRIQMVSASDSRDIIKDDLCASNTESDDWQNIPQGWYILCFGKYILHFPKFGKYVSHFSK